MTRYLISFDAHAMDHIPARFFPGGKTQLVTEAIDVALADVFGDFERTLGEAETFSEAIGAIVTPWRRLLVDHDFALGCPLAATICDAADNDTLRTHVSDSFAWWRVQVADAYTRFGPPQADAEAHATVLMAALEGALIVAAPNATSSPSTQSSASSHHVLQTARRSARAARPRAQTRWSSSKRA